MSINDEIKQLTTEAEVAQLRKALLDCAQLLDEVRTGEDFECVCHRQAIVAFNLLGLDDEGQPLSVKKGRPS